MNHQQIEQQDIIERFVRHQLSPNERRAFEEHYFACDQCFEQVQTVARFIAAVHHSAKRGVLADSATAEPRWKTWFKPALVMAAAATAVIAVALGILFFRQTTAPREEIAQGRRQMPAENVTPTPTPEDVAVNHPPRTPEPINPAQAKVPIALPTVLLDSARDARSGGNQLSLPANAASARLLFEVEPGRFDSFQLQVFDAGKRPVTSVNGIKANAQGTLAVTISTTLLPNGKFLLKLYGVRGGARDLVGEYDLTVRR